MYPPNYYPTPYPVNSYVPCMFCHTTVPVNAMPSHLSMCQNAHSTSFPTVTTSPYGSTQSIQYRRVVRVERKTVDDRTVHPIPVESNYSINQSHQKQLQWQNQSKPGRTLEDANPTYQSRQNYYNSSQSSNYSTRPLPQPPSSVTNTNCYSQSSQQRAVQSSSRPQVSRPIQSSSSLPPNSRGPPNRVVQSSMQQSQSISTQSRSSQSIQFSHPVQSSKTPSQYDQPSRPHQYASIQPFQASQSHHVQSHPIQPPQPVQSHPIQPPQPVQSHPVQPPQSQPKPVQSHPVQSSQFQPQPVQSLPRPVQTRHPPPSQPSDSPTVGTVEILQPGSLSDRIKMFESQSSAPVGPSHQETSSQPCPSPHQPIQVEEIKPLSVSQRKTVLEQQTPSVPPKQSTSPPLIKRSSMEHFEKKNLRNDHPNKLTIPSTAAGQLSLNDVLQKRMLQEQSQASQSPPTVTQPPNSSSVVTQFSQQPKPLVVPPTAEGQKSLESILQCRLQQGGRMETMETHSSQQRIVDYKGEEVYQQQVQTAYQSMNTVQKDSTPIISIDDNPDPTPSHLLYTANDGYIVLMNKEEVKSLFLPQSTLPNTGYFNGVLCVYSEQLCFYFFDDVTNEYQFIKNTIRSSCVNTRLDRILTGSNSMYYGILIMDKSQEDITSIWFLSSEERDRVFNTMS